MEPRDESVERSLEIQSRACANLGSPLYSRLLTDLLDDYRSGGLVARVLDARSERPVRDALPLRLLGAVHRIVLRGDSPELAGNYPSSSEFTGRPGARIPVDRFLDVVEEFNAEISDELGRQVQTNEVGRSVVHLSLANWLGHTGIREFDLIELGASAGLNMNFDRFHASTANGVMGAHSSRVAFASDWFHTPPTVADRPAVCVDRMGCDVSPLDATRPDDALRLVSFVWPDQTERLARLRGALAIALEYPPRIVDSSADAFLDGVLDSPGTRARLVFHSIVWQYLSNEVKDGVRRSLMQAGKRATPECPIIWARMEPAGDVADVRATVFSGKTTPDEYVLAEVGYHGQQLRWL